MAVLYPLMWLGRRLSALWGRRRDGRRRQAEAADARHQGLEVAADDVGQLAQGVAQVVLLDLIRRAPEQEAGDVAGQRLRAAQPDGPLPVAADGHGGGQPGRAL